MSPDEFTVYKPGVRAGHPAILSRRIGEKAVALRFASGHEVGASTLMTEVPVAERRIFSI